MPPQLTFRSVTKGFAEPYRSRSLYRRFFTPNPTVRRVVIQSLDLEIHPGERILILGQNGVGKTTLLKLCGGYIEPDEGQVRLEGEPIERKHRDRFGVMLSTHLLYPKITGYQNLEYTAYLHGISDVQKAVKETVETWGLEGFIDDLVGACSNGRKAMLALGRATIHRPDILLLDEPTVYLDEKNLATFTRYCQSTSQTLILTTQQPDGLMPLAHRVIRL